LPPPQDPTHLYHDDRKLNRRKGERNETRSSSHLNDSYRERSRSRSPTRRQPEVTSWFHDRHSIDEPDLIPQPKDYRPPSPEWKSRAGGVAIMKRKF
jgi:hypothetical protein